MDRSLLTDKVVLVKLMSVEQTFNNQSQSTNCLFNQPLSINQAIRQSVDVIDDHSLSHVQILVR